MATKRTSRKAALPADRVEAFKALGHESRWMMIQELAVRGELCVCELQKLVGADMSTVSRHLGILKRAGLVTDRRQGTWIHYSLVPAKVAELSCQLKSLTEGKA
jgi:DNA-binding transcriptional ArsR family regulator